MKVPSHTSTIDKKPLSIKNKPVFKVAPVLSPRTRSLLPTSPSTNGPSNNAISTSSSPVPSNIQSIANTMKLRMKAAIKTMVWNDKNRALLSTLISPTTSNTNSSFIQQQPQQQQQHNEKPVTLVSARLGTHTLLKQYISFVQEETGALVDMEPTRTATIDSLPVPSLDHQPHPLAFSGATLIESLVYDPIPKMTELYKQSGANQDQPPSGSYGSTTTKMEIDEPIQQITKPKQRRLNQPQHHGSNLDAASTFNKHTRESAEATGIRCICDNPHEEFGSMVQCDDCLYWLHLNCLAMDENDLEDTYRCPSCYITLGPGQHSSGDTVTWRLAAQMKSKLLASVHQSSRTHRIHKRHARSTKHKYSQLVQNRQRRIQHQRLDLTYNGGRDSSDSSDNSDLEDRQRQMRMLPKMKIDPSIKTTMTTPTGNVLVHVRSAKSAINLHDNIPMDEEALFDSDTTESDCEPGDGYQHNLLQQQDDSDHHHRGSISSSSSSVATIPSLVSSPSHASSDLDSTSDEHSSNDDFFPTSDSTILSTTATPANLDQETLLWLSRLAYLESMQSSSNPQCFTPHASDVFLCDDQQQQQLNSAAETTTMIEDHHTQLATQISSSPTRPDLPSTICSHDLSQFSFDDGPFWRPTQHHINDSCPFF